MGRMGHRGISSILGIGLALGVALPAAGQEYEEYERPAIEGAVRGYERSDGIIVLDDEGFCSHLLGGIWGSKRLTEARLIGSSKKKQKRARKAAVEPVSDAAVLATCAAVLNAFRLETPEDDALAPWARERAVVPEALARFLPVDPITDPLKTPPPLGEGGRTSGFGDRVSPPFVLQAGDYYAEPDAAACERWVGRIRSAADPSQDPAPLTAASYLYRIEGGVYYWDVSASDCDWSVDLVPRPMAEMPRLIGTGRPVPRAENPEWLTVEAAREALDAAGLVVVSCEEIFRFPYASRRIVEQDPPPGTLMEPGSSVSLVVRESGCDVLTAP
jgi:hypothetical protein